MLLLASANTQANCGKVENLSRTLKCQTEFGTELNFEIYTDKYGIECKTISDGIWGKSHLTLHPSYTSSVAGRKHYDIMTIQVTLRKSICGLVQDQKLTFNEKTGRAEFSAMEVQYYDLHECDITAGGRNTYPLTCKSH